MSSEASSRIDPDALAALEEERDFLLRSLEDLEAELAAGDIDQADYDQLKDDYTRRAAAVIRSVDQQQAALRTRPGIRWQQAAVWLIGLALLGAVSGMLIARASGTRSGGESITGGTRTSAVTRLNQARALLGDQESWDEAVDLYASVIDEQPSNTEALTYKAWVEYRRGDPIDGPLAGLEEAIAIDPTFADAVVFQTIILSDAGRYSEAASVLRTFDPATAPEGVVVLVSQRGLIGEVYGEALYAELVDVGPISLTELDVSTESALAAAGYLLTTDKSERAVVALKLYGAVADADPANSAALSRQAMLLALTLEPDLLDQAEDLVNQAVAVNPDDPEALLSRATVLTLGNRSLEIVCVDLEKLRAMDGLGDDILAQLDSLDVSCGS